MTREVRIVLLLTDEDKKAMAHAGTSVEAFVKSVRNQWVQHKRASNEIYDTHLSQRVVGRAEW